MKGPTRLKGKENHAEICFPQATFACIVENHLERVRWMGRASSAGREQFRYDRMGHEGMVMMGMKGMDWRDMKVVRALG